MWNLKKILLPRILFSSCKATSSLRFRNRPKQCLPITCECSDETQHFLLLAVTNNWWRAYTVFLRKKTYCWSEINCQNKYCHCDKSIFKISSSFPLTRLAAYNTARFNVDSLHGGNKKKDKQLLPDDGKGEVKVSCSSIY